MTKLVCIDTRPVRAESGIKLPLTLGQEYELLDVHKCKVLRFDVGVLHPKAAIIDRLYCTTCRESFNDMHVYFYAWRFIKLDPWLTEKDLDLQLQEDIEESRRVINPQIIIHQGNIPHETHR